MSNDQMGMAMTLRRSRLVALAAVNGATLMSVPAVLQAQTSGALEEIIVTARQREERIEDVPVTITAFTQTDIQNAGIERPTDFIALTPGVSQVQTAEAGDLQVNIRGINTGRDAETNFALVVDGVLQTNPNALNQELSGVTQIEILKGPQGALYGRNAVAGALIMTTRKPGDEWGFDVTAGVGSDNSYKGSIYAGGPIAGNAKGGFSAYTRNTDGQWDNLKLDCDDCVDFYEENGATARLLFDVGGGELDFKAKYSEIDAGAINFNAAIALADAAAFLGAPAFYEDPNEHEFRYINNIKPQNEQENLNLSLKGDWDLGFANLTGYVAYNDQENFFLTDGTSEAFNLYTFNIDTLAPAPEVVATCRASNDASLNDPGYLPPFFGAPSEFWFTPAAGGGSGFLPPYGPSTCGGYQYQQRDQTDTSVELRLTSPGDQRLRWVAGVYYADIDRDVIVAQGSDLNKGFQTQAFVPTSGPNPTDLLYDDTFNSTVYAVFGQLAFDVVDNLELALALRYDSEKREVSNNVPTCSATDDSSCRAQTPGFGIIYRPNLNFDPPAYINPAYTQNPTFATSGIPDRDKTFEEVQPKLSANWALTDDFSLFASYGYGFRSGGFNSSGSEATVNVFYGGLALDDGTPNLTNVRDDYAKEVSKAAELGFKSFFLERSLSVNAAIFHTKVDDMQFFNFFAGPFGLLRVVTNIDEVTIEGAELDFRWKANDTLSVFGGYGYTNGEIDKYAGRPYTEGNEVPYAPEYSGNLGAELSFPIGTEMQLLARLDATFVGETWFHPVQEERLPNLFTGFGFGEGEFSKMKRDPYAVLNLRISLQGERWGVTAWGRNIADEEYLAEIIPAPEFGGSFIHNAPGDSYGLDLNFKF
jgi:iron complex outermembrane receptor protein